MPENPKDLIGETKPPLHLIPPSAAIEEAVVMGLGASKYGPFNWRRYPVKASVYVAAALRHLTQWWDGQSTDPESGASHLAHARSCMGILLDAAACGNLKDDRPLPGKASELIEQFTDKPLDPIEEANKELLEIPAVPYFGWGAVEPQRSSNTSSWDQEPRNERTGLPPRRLVT